MIQLQKWICHEVDNESETCKTVVFVEGNYSLAPNCPECGSDKSMECLGEKHFEEIQY